MCGSILHSPLLGELSALKLALQATADLTLPSSSDPSADPLADVSVGGGSEYSTSARSLGPSVADSDGWLSDCSSGLSDDEGHGKESPVRSPDVS